MNQFQNKMHMPDFDPYISGFLDVKCAEVLTTRINNGMRNKGILVHDFLDENGGALKKIVEKKTNKQEYDVVKKISSIGSDSIFSKIYGFDENGFRIFMEYVEGVGVKYPLNSVLAHKLSKLIYTLNTDFDPSLITQNKNVVRSDVEYLDLLKRMAAYFPNFVVVEGSFKLMLERFGKLDKVFSHNDICWSNLSIGSDNKEDMNNKLIDFGLVGANSVGADLHHFARFSDEGFHNLLAREYSKLIGKKLDDILFASYFFALTKSLWRSANFAKKKKEKQKTAEIVNSYHLYLKAFNHYNLL